MPVLLDLIIIAVSYSSWDDGSSHNDAIDEVSSHCYVTGVPYLQVDCRHNQMASESLSTHVWG